MSAVQYDGKFHMIDSSMSNLVTTGRRCDAGVRSGGRGELRALVRERSLYSTSPNGFLTGTDTGRNLADADQSPRTVAAPGLRRLLRDGLKFRDYYYNWDWGIRTSLNVRDGEAYTRYYHPLGTTPTTGSAARR